MTAAPPPTVWVIVLHWQRLDDTAACLAALRAQTGAALQIVLVDNDPAEPARALVPPADPALHYLPTGRNLGYAEGNNVGLRYALEHNADYLLVLNNDTVAPPEMTARLAAALAADPQVGMACPAIASWAAPEHRFTPVIDWDQGSAGETWLLATDTVTRPVAFVSGCALLTRAAVARAIGLFDAAYFAYYEDVDWSLRCQRAGYQTVIVPETCVYHKGTPDMRPEKSAGAWYFFTRNQMRFLRLYTPRAQRLSRVWGYTHTCLDYYVMTRADGHTASAAAILDGWWGGLRGHTGAERRPAPRWVTAIIGARPAFWQWLTASWPAWRGRVRLRSRWRRLWPARTRQP